MMLQTIPVISVTDMQVSLQFYIEALEFELVSVWLCEGKIKWCSIENGGAAMVLQEKFTKVVGVSGIEQKKSMDFVIGFLCDDVPAVYNRLLPKSIDVLEPVINNHKWTMSLYDPDGFIIEFSSEAEPAE